MTTRSAPDGDAAPRFIAATGVGTALTRAYSAIRASLPWLLASTQVGLDATICRRIGGLTLRSLVSIAAPAAGSTLILLAATFGFAAAPSFATVTGPALPALACSPGGLVATSMAALSGAREPGVVNAHHLARFLLVLIAAPLLFPNSQEPRS